MKGTAIVTGASGGIGLEVCRILASEGYGIVAIARSADRLGELGKEISERYGTPFEAFPCDLTEEGAARAVYDRFGDRDVGILVNNAGFGDYGRFAECDLSKQERMIELNVLALTRLTRLFLPGMVSRGSGRILNTASVASFEPGPLMSVYYATKAYVLSLSEALSVELRGTGVTVTALCPGPTDTGFAKAAGADGANLFKRSTSASAAEVADYGVRKMMRGKPVAVFGIVFKVSLFFVRILPRSAVRRIVYGIQRRSAGE